MFFLSPSLRMGLFWIWQDSIYVTNSLLFRSRVVYALISDHYMCRSLCLYLTICIPDIYTLNIFLSFLQVRVLYPGSPQLPQRRIIVRLLSRLRLFVYISFSNYISTSLIFNNVFAFYILSILLCWIRVFLALCRLLII